jgi:hypothetical protein
MHTIELDSETEQALNKLAALNGKTPAEWLTEKLVNLIAEQSGYRRLPSLQDFRATLPYQTESAKHLCRMMRDGERY